MRIAKAKARLAQFRQDQTQVRVSGSHTHRHPALSKVAHHGPVRTCARVEVSGRGHRLSSSSAILRRSVLRTFTAFALSVTGKASRAITRSGTL